MFESRISLGRSAAAGIVVAMHVMLIVLLNRSTHSLVTVEVNTVVTYMVVAPHRKQSSTSQAFEQRYPVAADTLSVPTTPIEVHEFNTRAESPPIDWEATAAQAAHDYVKQHPELKTPPTLEESPSTPGRDGHVPQNVRQPGGKIVQWLNSQCYLTIRDGELDSGPPYNGARIQKTCILPTSNGHMFDQLKPEYLKKPVEDICPRDVASCDHKK